MMVISKVFALDGKHYLDFALCIVIKSYPSVVYGLMIKYRLPFVVDVLLADSVSDDPHTLLVLEPSMDRRRTWPAPRSKMGWLPNKRSEQLLFNSALCADTFFN